MQVCFTRPPHTFLPRTFDFFTNLGLQAAMHCCLACARRHLPGCTLAQPRHPISWMVCWIQYTKYTLSSAFLSKQHHSIMLLRTACPAGEAGRRGVVPLVLPSALVIDDAFVQLGCAVYDFLGLLDIVRTGTFMESDCLGL